MSLTELSLYLSEAVATYVLLLSNVKIGGLSILGVFIFYSVLGMVLVIVFRVETNKLFGGIRSGLPERYRGRKK